MKINSYPEKLIRKKILSKIKPEIINKNAPHWWGGIYVGKVLVTKVKIPNEHNRLMHSNKSKHIAHDLRLGAEDFNRLIDCSLKGTEYYIKLRAFI
ncbi:MAG: hypothetical protein KKD05_10805 [Candidatus Omnitrophica bacterium]|nr:hypothetical protein [Candidatus Omnitrophota bacterium]